MERGRVLKGRSDRAEILGTVGRRVLRLQYTLDANEQLTRSQNSTYLCQLQSVTSVKGADIAASRNDDVTNK